MITSPSLQISHAWPAPPGMKAVFLDATQPESVELRMNELAVVAWAAVFDPQVGSRVVPLVFADDRRTAVDATASLLFLGLRYADEKKEEADKRFALKAHLLKLTGIADQARAAYAAATAARVDDGPTTLPPPPPPTGVVVDY